MNHTRIIMIAICSLVFGIVFYSYQKEWLVLLLPHKTATHSQEKTLNDIKFIQHNITMFFWKYEKWHKESTNVIWSGDASYNVKTITNNWLMLLEDEKIIDTDIQLLSAIITPTKELFLSFNKDIFNFQDATYTKLMIVHGLLKTIHENDIPVQSVRFLIHHQTLIDDHLNFSIAWPIIGYL